MTDLEIVRELAKEYAEIALSDRNAEIIERYKRLNDREIVRPPVLAFEIPWGELAAEPELQCKVQDGGLRGLEYDLRVRLFQHRHFGGDMAYHPYWRCGIALNGGGIGLQIREKQIPSTTGAYIAAHKYEDVLADNNALERITLPEFSCDEAATEKNRARLSEIFDGILEVRKAGVSIYFASWDTISMLRGMESCLCDLYDRPEFIHAIMDKFTTVHMRELDEYERLNVLDTDPLYLHCTPAACHDMPYKDMDSEKITAADVWCRAMAQPLAVVSPEMQQEFDLRYTKIFADRCKSLYYGCCEPLDSKIANLRAAFPNLRRISITPWANVDAAAERIGRDFVLSYKPNPAFVGVGSFDPVPVINETRRVLDACRRNNTPCEFIIKDISTIKNRASNLAEWTKTVNAVIDEYY